MKAAGGFEARFHAWLSRETGIDPASLGADFVARALAERIGATFGGDAARELAAVARAWQPSPAELDAYWQLLNASAAERHALIELFVVPETWFFREREAFAALAALAVERLRTRPSQPVQVLSAPCSTGEEPYTAAMALIDAGLDAAQLRIDALDISARAIEHARRGEYGRNSFRGHALEFRARHFEPTAHGWRLHERIRDCVQFRHANLLDLDTDDASRYDFIFCRNVLIYFDRGAQERVLRTLDARLADDGLLFVGPAETGVVMRYGMSSARIPLAFGFRRQARRAAAVPAAPAPVAAGRAGFGTAPPPPVGTRPALVAPPEPAARAGSGELARPLPGAAPRPAGAPEGGAGFAGAGRSGAPGRPPRAPAVLGAVASTRCSLAVPASPAPARAGSLEAARALADAGQFEAAERAVRAVLDEAGPSADAYYLLGLIADAQGQPGAVAHYRKALYLAPTHREALTHLATLLDIAGDHEGARWLKERARRADAQAGKPGEPGGRSHARRR
ncbi:MCP methyltransferase [Burkholderia glumae]|uniref:CheR family methyltransferase n=4 Tax=Burkholderia glumae TaxID=337 RepID=UPI000F5D5B9C|nr:protein-glutamate O-methyltransferase CheR [Burkholderia glumae]MCM2495168.1 MCP methyltransferase [Burkholderia glumae]MCM2546032.1 MCP methyltransferase [Burkholderia glumae]MCM2551837.1 MCP methyltransferase [Burkholderia glumae]NVE25205.1 MCP methyltransferase [Burkholderia glumae]RQZ72410.1 MCP methyltransferase [Burkholderia glumae]